MFDFYTQWFTIPLYNIITLSYEFDNSVLPADIAMKISYYTFWFFTMDFSSSQLDIIRLEANNILMIIDTFTIYSLPIFN